MPGNTVVTLLYASDRRADGSLWPLNSIRDCLYIYVWRLMTLKESHECPLLAKCYSRTVCSTAGLSLSMISVSLESNTDEDGAMNMAIDEGTLVEGWHK